MKENVTLNENVSFNKGLYYIAEVLGEEHFVGDGLLILTNEDSEEANILRLLFQC